MTPRRMFIIAGPPGAGKSSLFALADFAENVFNADDRAAELNDGSFRNIPLGIRAIVNREFERFVHANVTAGTSFALETTLRSTITFEQARLARENGFRVFMRYIALDTVYDNSRSESRPILALAGRRGKIVWLADNFPQWLQKALGWQAGDLIRRRNELADRRG